MRWSIIRLIWFRELRDQLRDRRTLFMIAVLPVLLYPIAGLGMMQLALGFLKQQNVIGIQGARNLPPLTPRCTAFSPAPPAAWFLATPAPPGIPLGGIAHLTGAAALDAARRADPRQDYPPLLIEQDGDLRFATRYLSGNADAETLRLRADGAVVPDATDPKEFLRRVDRSLLDRRQVDLLLIVPPNFAEELEKNGRPNLYVVARDKDERSRLVTGRVGQVLARWKKQLKDVRLLRKGLPANYDEPFEVEDADHGEPEGKRASADLFGLILRIFPFVLVMWSLAGALYPAVDLCAGEKERGTMETLLISPASREEIVFGKFLTIWVFSAATALLNLLSMGLTTWQFGRALAAGTFWPLALFWAVVLLLPLSAFFSALCLSVGAYARSSKEGQYYLMPLFLLTMPLIFLTLAPGVELNPFYSMVPVTGVALLLHELMATGTPTRTLWLYFIPVLAPMVIYSWLALRWAIEQFNREEVLFREAERLDIGLWLRHLFRDKEALPNTAAALFCFGLMLALRWLAISVGAGGPVLTLVAVSQLAFVATPPLFMALLLTTRPRQGLVLYRPPPWSWPVAVLLALLVLPPLVGLDRLLMNLLVPDRALEAQLRALMGGGQASPGLRLQSFVVLALLPAVCEELAFRGFILSGLRSRFRPTTAVFLSAFLYATYEMNVFQFLPYFILGVVLGMIVVRSGSLVPAVTFRLVYNSLRIAPLLVPEAFLGMSAPAAGAADGSPRNVLLPVVCAATAAAILLGIWLRLPGLPFRARSLVTSPER